MPLKPKALLLLLVALLALAGALVFSGSRKSAAAEVVVYTSVDAEAAFPLFERFTKETGIQVVPRTDSEASKTTGLAERLLQLKDNPDGDVFWNSELSFTQVLAKAGVLEPYASPSARDIQPRHKDPLSLWTSFACRARVLIYNTQQAERSAVPRTLEGFCEPRWKGRFAVAKPLFGTARSHFVALVASLGEEKAFKLFRAWRENGVLLAASNSDVRNRVVDGTCDLGLTDTDDALSAMDRNKPVNFTVPDQTAEWPGAFLIPNSVAILKNCPHRKEARAFVDFLLKPETEKWLAENGMRQIPVRDVGAQLPEGLKNLKAADVDWEKVAALVVPLGERIYRVLSGEEQ
jgi:iron(III) transport system substrate-binding protein